MLVFPLYQKIYYLCMFTKHITMKTTMRLMLLLGLFCFVGTTFAQDVIVKKDNSTVLCKVIEVSKSEIKYKKWSNQDGPTYSVNTSDIVRINYENGEVDNFNEQTVTPKSNTYNNVPVINTRGYLTRMGNTLAMNGSRLEPEDVQMLVTEEQYETYLSGRRLVNAGTVFAVFCGIGLGLALDGYIFYYVSDLGYGWLVTAIVGSSVALVTMPIGLTFDGIGGGKLRSVANEYNGLRSYTSFNVSPSLMKIQTPQSQTAGAGVGLTLSMSF